MAVKFRYESAGVSGMLNGGLLANGVPYTVRLLTMADRDCVLSLQQTGYESMENKEFLSVLSEEEVDRLLSSKGLVVGVFIEGELIAFRALLSPAEDDKEHLALDINVELQEVFYQEITVVHPDYRGNRLQQLLAGVVMYEWVKRGRGGRYVCATVAPFNFPSLKDKFSQGMWIAALKEKYGGKLRYVFVKDLKVEPECSESTFVPMRDYPSQIQLLAEGWRGVGMKLNGLETIVEYRK